MTEYINKESLLNGIYNRQDDSDFDIMAYIARFPARTHSDFTGLMKRIEDIAQDELERANKTYPLFHSLHEGYAVLQEEIDEVIDNNTFAMKEKAEMWNSIKDNDSQNSVIHAKDMKYYLLQATAEMIQCVAMCQKIIDSEEQNADK